MLRRTFIPAAVLLLVVPAPAYAAGGHLPLVTAGILGSIFGTIGHAVLGAFSWTIGLASKFVLTTLAALVKLLIPHSWINQGLQIMEWIVAVPNYAGKISSPGGGQQYGFAGINALRDLFMWLGVAVVPLSLTYATSRAMIGEYEPVGIPVLRVVAVAVVIASYPYWWSQAAALTDQITHAILTLPDVAQGLDKLMQYAVDGVALGGWQLIDLGLMGAIGIELLGLIFLKVVVILLGALLYATGPLMIGLVPTRAGGAILRAWGSAVTLLFALGIGWATLFAVGALLINDAGTAGPLIAGNSTFGSLVGGLLLAVAGLASLWLCLKATKEASGLLRLQVAGLLALGHSHGSGSSARTSTRSQTTGRSLRDYGSRLARATTAAGGELAGALPGGTALATAGRTAGYVGRRGLVGTAAAGARHGAKQAAAPTASLVGRSRAGAVAVSMAHAGTANWRSTKRRAAHRGAGQQSSAGSTGQPAAGGNRRVIYSPRPKSSGQVAAAGGARSSGKAGASTRSPKPDGRLQERSARPGAGARPSTIPAREGSVARQGKPSTPLTSGQRTPPPKVDSRQRSPRPPVSSKPPAPLPAPKQRVLRRPHRPRPKGKS
jgi:hypothetical protein